MIKSWSHKGLKNFFETGSTAGIQAKHADKLANILLQLNDAEVIEDMNVYGFRLHPLKGDMRNLWSVKVNANWRIVFRFEDGDAYVVDYTDYH